LMGHDSKTLRQVDVVIRGVVNQYRILVIVECKDEARPVDLGTIEGFVSKIKDVRANKGVMVSTSGFTSAAIELARAHCIDTRTYVDTENIEWKTEMSIPFLLTYSNLSGQGKSGHAWSLQNRPYGMARDVVLFILLSPDQASLFWFSSFAVRILGCDRGGEDDPAWQ
jgi:Restriction endonuclease